LVSPMRRLAQQRFRNSREIHGIYGVNAEGRLNAVVVSGTTASILLRRSKWWVYSKRNMKTARIMPTDVEYRRPYVAAAVRVLWNAVRLPIVAALLALEPLVGLICGAGLVLGVLACILFEISSVGPRFPLVKALSISLSFGVILFLYYGLLSLFVEE
jgi:hypothetical protein